MDVVAQQDISEGRGTSSAGGVSWNSQIRGIAQVYHPRLMLDSETDSFSLHLTASRMDYREYSYVVGPPYGSRTPVALPTAA